MNIFQNRFGVPAILIILVILIYAQTLSFGYVNLDEEELIVQRQSFLKDLGNIPAVFTHDASYPNAFSPFYRPFLTLTFMMDAVLGGGTTVFSHLTNVFLHIGAVLLLWLFFLEFGLSRGRSFILSLFFAVHPAITQAVAWVPGRNDSLLAVFILAACIFYLKFLRSRSWWMYGLHVACFAGALLTKESAIVLPFLLILWSRRRSRIFIAPWAVLLVSWFMVHGYAVTQVVPLRLSAMFSQVWHHAAILLVYLGKVFLPIGLSVMPSAADSSLWYGLMALVILGIVFWLSRRYLRIPTILFGGLWFLLFLLPSLISYEHPSRIAFYEHRLYLPLVGILLMIAVLPWEIWMKRFPRLLLATTVAVFCIFAVLSFSHARVFREQIPFWEQATRSSPSLARAHNSLGIAYATALRLDDAFREYQIAYRLNPNDYLIHTSLGVAYLQKRDFALAEKHLKEAIAINPNKAPAHHNLGFLYATQGRMKEAEQEWLLALQANPWYALSHKGLAIYYAQQKRFEESRFHVEQLIKMGVPVPPELLK